MDFHTALAEVSEIASKYGHVTESKISTLVQQLEFEEVDQLLEMLSQLQIAVVTDTEQREQTPSEVWKYPNPMNILKERLTLDQVNYLRQRLIGLGFPTKQVSLYCAVRMKHPHRGTFEILSRTSKELAVKMYEAEGPLGEIWREPKPKAPRKPRKRSS